MTTNPGTDYGRGLSNIDTKTGIRYGVINQNEVLQIWCDSSEADYGKATCPDCGNDAKEFEVIGHKSMNSNGREIVYFSSDIPEHMEEWERAKYESEDYYCENCKKIFGSESAFPESPIAFSYVKDGYKCFQSGDDTDIFIELSPYYTYAQFCSPCAPGAGYLMEPFKPESKYRKTINPINNHTITKSEWFKMKAKDAGYPKVYCFGHSWFEDGKAPYPVFSVETGELIRPEEA